MVGNWKLVVGICLKPSVHSTYQFSTPPLPIPNLQEPEPWKLGVGNGWKLGVGSWELSLKPSVDHHIIERRLRGRGCRVARDGEADVHRGRHRDRLCSYERPVRAVC